MKGYRFFEELNNKGRRSESSKSTVVAVLLQEHGRGWSPVYIPGAAGADDTPVMEAIASVYDKPNSPVCGSSVSRGYLDKNCKRVSEKRAREVHPALFEYLDS